MSQPIESIRSTPETITLYGEGLRNMDLRHFKNLVQNLGYIGIKVDGIDTESTDEVHSLENIKPDIAIMKNDFIRVAEAHDMSKISAGKAWNALLHPRREYRRAMRRAIGGEQLRSWEIKAIGTPRWQLGLGLSDHELSYVNLQKSYESAKLDLIEGIGPKYVDFVGHVLSDTETRFSSDQFVRFDNRDR